MHSDSTVPLIDERFICIVDREAVVLAAVVSSYLYSRGTYPPILLFSRVKHSQSATDTSFGDQYLSNLAGRAASIYINNAWARMAPRDIVIMVGLSDEQKSYLMVPKSVRTIQIASISDVRPQLLSFISGGTEELKCKSSDVLRGLTVALKDGKRLSIDEEAQVICNLDGTKHGIVVVESLRDDASPVVAINYARSVDADICVVDALGQYEGRNAQAGIYNWKEKNDRSAFEQIRDAAGRELAESLLRITNTQQFFTEGLPYSLAIENAIPCSHVNLNIRPDLFILNNIIFAAAENLHSAIVFSPVFFDDEETDELRTLLPKDEYYVRAMIGQDASVSNLDFSVQFFPYDILHICSHGGKVDGYEMTAKFVEKDHNTHTV
jgi:hypothetical protein